MNKLLRYKAKSISKGMTPEEIRGALDDAETKGTIVTVKATNAFNGKLQSLAIDVVQEDKGVQA